MTNFTATIRWRRGGALFSDNKYGRAHTWSFDGGVEVPGSSSPHVVPVPYSDPAAVDPEEAFVASISSCHMLWFLDIASRRGYVVESYDDPAEGRMRRNAEGQMAVTQVTLRPHVAFAGPAPDDETHRALHAEAHHECFIANSVKTEIVCEPTAVR
jgi:organic hydroperoxide reductase OsmC/OhrA